MLRAVGRTQEQLFLKESVSFTNIYGYGLFRDLFLHLGERWAGIGCFREKEEIFYLNLEDIRAPASVRKLSPSPEQRARQRVSAMKSCRDVELPEIFYGDELIISHSDVAWTALFSKAGAVVSEAGGLLSHSSIVAREYNIPCVVGVTGAMNLVDGPKVAVDGYRGSVHVLEEVK